MKLPERELSQGVVARLLTPDDSSNDERRVYRLTREEVSGLRVLDIVMKEYPMISAEQLHLYMETTNAVTELLKGNRMGGKVGIGIVNQDGIEFRWEGSPISRIQQVGARLQTISEYRTGIPLDRLYDLRGEDLHAVIKNLDVREQEMLIALAEKVFSQETERELLEENMQRTSAVLSERTGVAGIRLTASHTRIMVLPTGKLILGATDIAGSVNDLRRLYVPEQKIWPEGDT